MKSTAALLAAPLAACLSAGPAVATTWDFYATECSALFDACTPLPSNPFLLGTFEADGSGSSTLANGVETGDTFSMDFGPLFTIVDSVQLPFSILDKATGWNIVWGADGKPVSIDFESEGSTLTLRGGAAVRTASDGPGMVGCQELGSCLYDGAFVDPAAVPEPARMWLAWPIALLGLFGLRRQWMRAC